MRRVLTGIFLVTCVASSAGAATLAEIEALVEEANSALRAGGDNRAESLQKAIEKCKKALEMLEEVEGLSEAVKDQKSSEILATLYWCKKMMPMDLSGQQKVGAAKKGGAKPKPDQRGPSESRPKPKPVRKSKELDQIAFELARDYAARASHDLEGIVIRYEGIAALYPNTSWGKKAQVEAAKARTKLERARQAALASSKELVERLRYDEALAAIEREKRNPRMKDNISTLEQLAEDVQWLRQLHAKVIDAVKLSQVRLDIPFGELGIKKTGWLVRGDANGVEVALGSKSAPKTRWSWGDLGARAMVLLGNRYVRGNNVEWTELVAVCATVTEEYVVAHENFGKLLVLAPERANKLTGHFQRATDGYQSSGEGMTTIKLSEAKKLVMKRKYEEAFALINELRKTLASSSATVDMLREVNEYRRELMFKKGLNGRGLPLSLFEKKVRAAFGGDAKLDENTGRIEVSYDFSNSRQFRDFGIAYLYGQWRRTPEGFAIAKGKLHAIGKKYNVFWRFPATDVDVQVEVTYLTEGGRFELSANNSTGDRYGRAVAGFADRAAGYISTWSDSISEYNDDDDAMIWRPGETATLRLKASDEGWDYYNLYFNGDRVGYTYSYSDSRYGGIGFGFNGGKGTIDNIVIRATLDMEWFKEFTSSIRGGR